MQQRTFSVAYVSSNAFTADQNPAFRCDTTSFPALWTVVGSESHEIFESDLDFEQRGTLTNLKGREEVILLFGDNFIVSDLSTEGLLVITLGENVKFLFFRGKTTKFLFFSGETTKFLFFTGESIKFLFFSGEMVKPEYLTDKSFTEIFFLAERTVTVESGELDASFDFDFEFGTPFLALGLRSQAFRDESKLNRRSSKPSTFPNESLLDFKSSLTDTFSLTFLFRFGNESEEIRSLGSPTHGRLFGTGFKPRRTGTDGPESSRVT
jgi:hypothetical protein